VTHPPVETIQRIRAAVRAVQDWQDREITSVELRRLLTALLGSVTAHAVIPLLGRRWSREDVEGLIRRALGLPRSQWDAPAEGGEK
jgi:hypothetical protein